MTQYDLNFFIPIRLILFMNLEAYSCLRTVYRFAFLGPVKHSNEYNQFKCVQIYLLYTNYQQKLKTNYLQSLSSNLLLDFIKLFVIWYHNFDTMKALSVFGLQAKPDNAFILSSFMISNDVLPGIIQNARLDEKFSSLSNSLPQFKNYTITNFFLSGVSTSIT